MRLLSKAVLFAFALSAFSTLGFSAEEKPGAAGEAGMPSFTEADQDKNGAVEQSEAAGIQGLNFSAADTDKDGKLSRSEYEAATKAGKKQ